MLPGECMKFKDEVIHHFTPHHYSLEHLDYIYQWRLDNQASIDEWVCYVPALGVESNIELQPSS